MSDGLWLVGRVGDDVYGLGLVGAILDIQAKVNVELRMRVATCEIRNAVELQEHADQLLKRHIDHHVNDYADVLCLMGLHVEIEQDDAHDLRWRLHMVTRSAIDLLGELA